MVPCLVPTSISLSQATPGILWDFLILQHLLVVFWKARVTPGGLELFWGNNPTAPRGRVSQNAEVT